MKTHFELQRIRWGVFDIEVQGRWTWSINEPSGTYSKGWSMRHPALKGYTYIAYIKVILTYKRKNIFKLKKMNFEKDERLQWNLFMNQFLNYSILHGRATDNYLPSWVQ